MIFDDIVFHNRDKIWTANSIFFDYKVRYNLHWKAEDHFSVCNKLFSKNLYSIVCKA